jgi:hypothetical protein
MTTCMTVHFFSPRYISRPLMNDFLKKQPSTLRTLLYASGGITGISLSNISKYTSLRALHIDTGFPRQIYLPGQIYHLRYLNLSHNWHLEQLPEDISLMYHLQTLNISHCRLLCHLPKDMKYMASLRHLYTNGCDSLTNMPPGLGQITSLQTNIFCCWCQLQLQHYWRTWTFKPWWPVRVMLSRKRNRSACKRSRS